MENQHNTPAAERFAKAATDLARELINDECTAIDHYIHFENGDVFAVNMFKLPESAIARMAKHYLKHHNPTGPDGQ